MQDWIVRDDDYVVFRHGHIHFECIHPLLNGVLECRKSVFGTPGARAAVSVYQNPGLRDGLC
jgi:hypothetical protein